MKKRISLVALLLTMVMLLVACGGGGLEGKWKVTDGAAFGMPADAAMFMTFKGGKLTVEAEYQGQKMSMELNYKTEGDKITIEDNSSSNLNGEMTYKVDGNKLTLTSNGIVVTLDRQ